MWPESGKPMVEYEAPVIRFEAGGTRLAEERLESLVKAYIVTCFNPEPAPVDTTTFDLLEFERSMWLIPDGSAERFIFGDWAEHLATRGGYIEAEAGALPEHWRKRTFLLAHSLYQPKAALLGIEPPPFLQLGESLDPRTIAERNQARFRRLVGEG